MGNYSKYCNKCFHGELNFSYTEDSIEISCSRCGHFLSINKNIDEFMIEVALTLDKIKQIFSCM